MARLDAPINGLLGATADMNCMILFNSPMGSSWRETDISRTRNWQAFVHTSARTASTYCPGVMKFNSCTISRTAATILPRELGLWAMTGVCSARTDAWAMQWTKMSVLGMAVGGGKAWMKRSMRFESEENFEVKRFMSRSCMSMKDQPKFDV